MGQDQSVESEEPAALRRGKTVAVSPGNRSRAGSLSASVPALSPLAASSSSSPSPPIPSSPSSSSSPRASSDTMRRQQQQQQHQQQQQQPQQPMRISVEGVLQPPSYMNVPSYRSSSASARSSSALAAANRALLALPPAVLTCVLSHLAASDLAALAASCKALRAYCFPGDLALRPRLPPFPPAVHVQTDVAAVAAKMKVGVAPDVHLAALRVLLTQATRFPRVRLTSASFVNCGPHARELLEACGLHEEVKGSGYLSATTPLAKARLSEGREMLELLVAQLELQGLEGVLGKMLLPGAGTARACARPLLGAAESIGRRLTSEDTCCGGEGWAAVFDGHGGRNAALLASVVVADEVTKNGATLLGLKSVLATAHRLIVKAKLRAGTTAVLCAVQEELLLAGWVGDSRAILLFSADCLDGVAGGGFLRLTEDHRPSNESEAKRVLAAGGKISSTSSGSREMRINGELGVSRALGDCDYEKWGLSHDAEAVAVRRTLRDAWLVLGCDGLWDVVPEAAAALAAQPCKTPQELADRLVSLAYARNSDDNITCVVIDVRCSDPPPAAKHTLQLLEQNVAQLLKTLLSPNRGLAFSFPLCSFRAPQLLDLLRELRPSLSRSDALLISRELAFRGHLVNVVNRSIEFADDEHQIWRLCDALQISRCRLDFFPCARVKGPPCFYSCPVCYCSFETRDQRISHLFEGCSKKKR